MSSARRQPSTTSLAKYARSTSTAPDDYVSSTGVRSLDFCNAFWGLGDGGVDVLFARMRGAARTMEELRNFWKERATIEEEYAKRLAKLAKMSIGKDEIGELRNSIDTLRLETDKQAGGHMQLAQQLRTEIEGSVAAFATKQQQHKKIYQTAIEKEFRTKQTREQHASKAREKYESDCVRINSYTAQSTLVQGKDLEKINLKLERAQQTVQLNENDYAQFTRVLQETVQKWEQDWRAFCDSCQDLEEERLEFMKDNLWSYANAVSTVCVSDDESCEKMRLALEQMEPDKEMDNFVRDYGTGSAIPEPPTFIDYANTDAPPVNHNRIMTRPAAFARVTQRVLKSMPAQEEETPFDTGANHAGIGAGGGPPTRGAPTEADLSRSATHRSQKSQANGINGHMSPSREQSSSAIQQQAQAQQAQRRSSNASALLRSPSQGRTHGHAQSQSHSRSQMSSAAQVHHPDPVDPTVSSTQLVIGNNAWEVDPSNDPQQQRSGPSTAQATARKSPPVGTGAGDDPLVKQMAELSTAAAAAKGPERRNTVRKDTPSSGTSPPLGGKPSEALSTPALGSTRGNSGDVAAGSYPLAHSRPSSPNPVPPTPVLAVPPSRGGTSSTSTSLSGVSGPHTSMSGAGAGMPPSSAPGSVSVEQVVANYQRPFPGEPRSRANSYVGVAPPPIAAGQPPPGTGRILSQSPQQMQQDPGPRPTSRAGYPGIGTTSLVANAPSPARGMSPVGGIAPGAVHPYGKGTGGPVVVGGAPQGGSQQLARTTSVSYVQGSQPLHHQQLQLQHHPQHQPQQQRPVTPSNPVGIALGPDGRVVHDQMAVQAAVQHRLAHSVGQVPVSSYGGGGGYGDGRMGGGAGQVLPPAQPPSRNEYYGAVVPTTQAPPGTYGGHPAHYESQHASHYGAPPSSHVQQQAVVAPPSSYGGGGGYGPPVRHPSVSGGGTYGGAGQYASQQGYHQPPVMHSSTNQQLKHYGVGGAGNGFRAPSPAVGRSPSPQPPRGQYAPTCSYTDDGRPILFYVKALYDYAATIDEEFDFQAGDIIAVTETPEDGWWSGELLDEARKQPGRHVFPSNFVCLF
ncbi:hypothetical protein EDC04DRAFT_710864 [Pisolithus marmoratus]|nr:hypothetical protein EDC04DRAFT_710864 [Pisolithus marmoratus]